MVIENNTSVRDEKIIFAIDSEYLQDFAEANFKRRLTEKEMEMAVDAFNGGDDNLSHHIYDAMGSAIEYALDSNK